MRLFTRNPSKNFLGVGIALILVGVIVLVLGVVQGLYTYFADYTFGWPAFKVVSGLVVIALGYIVLQLELLRLERQPK